MRSVCDHAMAAPKSFSFLKKAHYLIPFVKPLSLGFFDPKDELTKELLGAGLELLGDEAKEKIKDFFAKEPDAASGLLDEHLVRHTGAVLGSSSGARPKTPPSKSSAPTC